MTFLELIKYRRLIVKGAESLTDEDALEVPSLYDEWAVGLHCEYHKRYEYGGKLWRCEQTHDAIEGYEPPKVPALFSEVGKPNQGDSPDNPIPYNNNMELFNGKYYEQFGIVYLCFRDSGQPLYNNLADLIGLYVEIVRNQYE